MESIERAGNFGIHCGCTNVFLASDSPPLPPSPARGRVFCPLSNGLTTAHVFPTEGGTSWDINSWHVI